jgi:integrase
MAVIRKRSWTTPAGVEKTAWQVDYRKKEADAWLIQTAHDVSRGVHTADGQSITVANAAEMWIKTAEGRGRERSTIKQYQELARLHIRPLIGTERLSRLTMPGVEAFADALTATRSKAMAAKAVRALSSILTEAQRRGLVAQNVAKGVKVIRPKRDKKKVIIPPREDLRAMLDGAPSGFRPLLMTAIFTGLRSSELRALRRSDVNLKVGEITVEQRADQWGVIGSPKSEAGHRTIPIPPMLIAELRAWMLRSPVSQLGLLFPNSEGGVRLHSNMLNRDYWPLQVTADLTRIGPTGQARARYDFHALRHAAASAWIRQGVDLKCLTTWMGHSSVQITIDTYGHLLKDERSNAAIAAAAQADLLG